MKNHISLCQGSNQRKTQTSITFAAKEQVELLLKGVSPRIDIKL